MWFLRLWYILPNCFPERVYLLPLTLALLGVFLSLPCLYMDFDNHFHLCQSGRWKIISYCSFYLHLFDCQPSECLFIYILGHLYFSLFVLFVHFTNRIFVFTLICTRSLYSQDTFWCFPWFIVYLFALFKVFLLVRNVKLLFDHRTSM